MASFRGKKQQQRTIVIVVVAVILTLILLALADKRGARHLQSESDVTVGVDAPTAPVAQEKKQPSPPAVVRPAAASLSGSTFRLASHNGFVLPGNAQYTLSFKEGTAFEDGFVQAKFCNTMNGAYSLEGNVITAALAATKMFCNEPHVMEAESAFGQLIGGGARATLQGRALTLTDNITTMVFIKQ